MRPAGAFTYTVLLIPFLKLSGTKLEMAPLSKLVPKYGSQRRPVLSVTRSDTLHVSCANSPRYH